MIRRHTSGLRAALMAADFLAAVALFVAVSVARYGSTWQEAWQRLGAQGWLAATTFGAGWVIVLWLRGMYRLRARWSLRGEVVALLQAIAVLAVATIVLLFVIQVSDASRLVVGVLFGSLAALSIASRIVLRWLFASLRQRGLMMRMVLVVGANPAAQEFADRVERHTDLGLRVVGHLAEPGAAVASVTRPVIGGVEQITDVLHSHVVDEVAICLPVGEWDVVEPLTRICADEGRIVRIPGDGRGPHVSGGYIEEFDGAQITSLAYGPDRALSLLFKRATDVVVAALGLVLLSPLLLVVALRIRAVDGAPVIFRQTRVGLHGRRFELLKFRTMEPDAEARLAELEGLNEVRGRAFKVTDDPRLTRTGRVLRRLSIDELPQLWNVIRGEMSLVGPRPPLPHEVDGYDIWHRRRLSMKPGITGLWQVSARREPEFDRWVKLDLEYIDSWSLWLDLKILLRTIPAVVTQEGR